MRELEGSKTTTESSHRGQFYRWIDTLGAGGNTPTHFMMWNAGEYLKTTGADNPWNAETGYHRQQSIDLSPCISYFDD